MLLLRKLMLLPKRNTSSHFPSFFFDSGNVFWINRGPAATVVPLLLLLDMAQVVGRVTAASLDASLAVSSLFSALHMMQW